jgi:thioredoxin 1
MILNGSKEDFIKILQNSNVLIDFWASWCHPCKALEKQIEILNKDRPELIILRIDVDKNREFASEFYVQNIPTLVWSSQGNPPVAITGFHTAGAILKRLGI